MSSANFSQLSGQDHSGFVGRSADNTVTERRGGRFATPKRYRRGIVHETDIVWLGHRGRIELVHGYGIG